MKTICFGVDFGSSNTSITLAGKGIVLQEATCTAFDARVQDLVPLEYGEKAKKLALKNKQSVNLIFPVQEGLIVNPAAAVLILKEYIARVTKGLNASGFEAVFTVPCGSTPEERGVLKAAGYAAGLSKVNFIPAAVAVCLGADKNGATHINSPFMTVNIGGGHTEVAVVDGVRVVNGCSVNLGGSRLDELIQAYLKKVKNLHISRGVAEKIKNDVSSLYLNDMTQTQVSGADAATGESRTESISAAELSETVHGFYITIAQVCRQVFKSCGEEVQEVLAENGAVICGGCSKILGLQEFLASKTGLLVRVCDDPVFVIGKGLDVLLNNKELLKEAIANN